MTDRRGLSPTAPQLQVSSLLGRIEALASAGVDWVQIREKDLSAREVAALTREAVLRTAGRADSAHPTTRVLVNDRLDVALIEGAAGVHLAESSLPMREAKRLVEAHSSENDFLIGVSCHSLEGAKAAASNGASYVFFGPVFATPSKAAYGTPQGVDRLAEVCRWVSIPVLAIGGITLEKAAACLRAGAAGIAAIRLFQDASDPAATIAALRRLPR